MKRGSAQLVVILIILVLCLITALYFLRTQIALQVLKQSVKNEASTQKTSNNGINPNLSPELAKTIVDGQLCLLTYEDGTGSGSIEIVGKKGYRFFNDEDSASNISMSYMVSDGDFIYFYREGSTEGIKEKLADGKGITDYISKYLKKKVKITYCSNQKLSQAKYGQPPGVNFK